MTIKYKTVDIGGNTCDKYRKVGNSLYEYDIKTNSYIHCYQAAGLSKSKLIKAFLDSLYCY